MLIEREGGTCHLVEDASEVYDVARRLADELDGHYIDQFTYAERATDWRGNNNIAESIFEQMALEPHPVPAWIVVGAGTGGTSTTIGRYTRYCGLATCVAVVDPEGSAFLPSYDGRSTAGSRGSRIEGIGRPRVEPSFIPTVVDRMFGVPDAASIAAMRFLRQRTGLRAGGSTGTNLYGALRLACEMRAAGRPGSIVTLMCDPSERYAPHLFRRRVARRPWTRPHGIPRGAGPRLDHRRVDRLRHTSGSARRAPRARLGGGRRAWNDSAKRTRLDHPARRAPLTSAPRDGVDDVDDGAGPHDRLQPLTALGVLAVDEDVDVPADPTLLVAHPGPDAWPRRQGDVEHLLERGAGSPHLGGSLALPAGQVAEHPGQDHPHRTRVGRGAHGSTAARTQSTSGSCDAMVVKLSPSSSEAKTSPLRVPK